MLIVDADHFKNINDRYGHPIGDVVLKGLATCLSASVHRPHDLVCRIGGEEFAVLLRETDREGAFRVATKIHDSVRTLAVASAGIQNGSLTVSIGLATGPVSDGYVAPEDLYRRADAAVYEARGMPQPDSLRTREWARTRPSTGEGEGLSPCSCANQKHSADPRPIGAKPLLSAPRGPHGSASGASAVRCPPVMPPFPDEGGMSLREADQDFANPVPRRIVLLR